MNVNSVKRSIFGLFLRFVLTATQAQAFDLQPFVQQAVPNLVVICGPTPSTRRVMSPRRYVSREVIG